jgi:DNA (cytosine-5)-methyltransferase 1
MTAYYNENDPFAAAWLRELIKAGLIAHGVVDERSIEDVTPNDLVGFVQCHWFAGIGGWSLALRIAGFPDSAPVWTGSCPCQPFSAAGKGNGFLDERHLWPSWFHLISECRPATIFGEQVASKATGPWFDLVQADLEGMGYAFGCVPFPAAGVGAPHLRDRAYWVADSEGEQQPREMQEPGGEPIVGGERVEVGGCGYPERLADSDGESSKRNTGSVSGKEEKVGGSRVIDGNITNGHCDGCSVGGLADTKGLRRGFLDSKDLGQTDAQINTFANPTDSQLDGQQRPTTSGTGPTNGMRHKTDWLFCRDGKWRPVEPGTFPLAHGVPNRVGKLRGYGNSIVPAQAAEFIISVDQVSNKGLLFIKP